MTTTAELSENSHQGFEGLKAAFCLASMDAKSNNASGLRGCLRRKGTGSRCSGKERDETGLDYFGARYFSGALGRFMSVDPENAGAKTDDPPSWNAYAYARNNPLKYIDPDGRLYEVVYNYGNFNQSYQFSDWGFELYKTRLSGSCDFISGTIYYKKNGAKIGTYKQLIDDGLLALKQAGELAKPVGDATTTGMKIFGYIAAPALMGIADYLSGEDDSAIGLALAIIPGKGFLKLGRYKILQKGGNTILKSTAKALNEYFGMNLHSREWGRALEALKKANQLPNDFHGKITANGDFLNKAGKVIDNIGNYLP